MKGAVVVATVIAARGGTAGLAVASSGSGAGGQTPVDIETATATIERTTLLERDEVDGTLGYGEPDILTNRGRGTLTALPDLGSVVERNGVLYELDGTPVRLFYGDVPAYRRLAEGVSDGRDVEQLEQNLRELGFARGLISTPDRRWGAATTAAVKRWQESMGVDEDGVVEEGEIVFAPGAVRVSGHPQELGAPAQPGAPALAVTGTTRQVHVDLAASKQRLAVEGAKVEITLPDGATTAGTITEVGTVASAPSSEDGRGGGGGDAPTVDVTIVLDDPVAAGSLDGAPVTVGLTRQSKEDVLAVPVQALLALAEGGYAVEVAGEGRLVRVEPGLFSEGLVEVSGEGLREGLKVVIPK